MLGALTSPVVAATLLAGLVLPTAAEANTPPHPTEPSAGPESAPGALLSPAPAPAVVVPPKPVRVVREAEARRYRVKSGDCLWTISRMLLGKGRQWRSIYAANQGIIQDPDLIYPGQLLLIPSSVQASDPDHHARSSAPGSKHGLRTTERASAHKSARASTRAVVSRKADGGYDVAIKPIDRRDAPRMARPPARVAPAKPVQPVQPGVVGDRFQGHHRVDGHFYLISEGKLVWADDRTPVRGDWSKRLAEQVYPNRQANLSGPQAVAVPQPPAPPAPVALAPVAAPEAPSPEPTIQGHRRVNGTFFVRTEAGLVWADDGTPMRPASATTP